MRRVVDGEIWLEALNRNAEKFPRREKTSKPPDSARTNALIQALQEATAAIDIAIAEWRRKHE